MYGWERPQYFGEPEVHTFNEPTFPIVAAEVNGTRERVGIADLTAFAKFEVTGADAATLLDRVSANKIPATDGGLRLVHMLTELGGIECEMTITRLGEGRYYLNSAIMATTHDEDWLNHHILDGEDVTVTNVTDQRGIVAITGPRSRDVLETLTDADLHAPAFRWLTARERSPSPVWISRRCASPMSANSAGNFTWPSRTCPPSTARWWPPVNRTDWCTSARTP